MNLVGTFVVPVALLERGLGLCLPAPAALFVALGVVLSLGLAGALLLVLVVIDWAGNVPVQEVSS